MIRLSIEIFCSARFQAKDKFLYLSEYLQYTASVQFVQFKIIFSAKR